MRTTELDPVAGYDAWAQRYDEPGNPIIALERSAVWSMLEPLPPGRALDAACGTGRHAQRLCELGHDVVGVDTSPEMLARAAANAPSAAFIRADLREVPAADARFDLVICGLALSHLDDIAPALRELARVLRPGGRMVISVLHPFLALLGWQAPFTDREGARGFIREHPHRHARWIACFRDAGLELLDCREPELDAAALRSKRRAFARIPEATIEAYAGLPAVLVWELRRR